MIFMIASAAVIMVVALVASRMITDWHNDTMKNFNQVESNLRNTLNAAIKEQKDALVELNNIKSQVVNAENRIESLYLDDGFSS